jgi:hypothetical protein
MRPENLWIKRDFNAIPTNRSRRTWHKAATPLSSGFNLAYQFRKYHSKLDTQEGYVCDSILLSRLPSYAK